MGNILNNINHDQASFPFGHVLVANVRSMWSPNLHNHLPLCIGFGSGYKATNVCWLIGGILATNHHLLVAIYIMTTTIFLWLSDDRLTIPTIQSNPW